MMDKREMLQTELGQFCDEVRRKLRALEPDYDRYQRLRLAYEMATTGGGRLRHPFPHVHVPFPAWLIEIIGGLGGQRL